MTKVTIDLGGYPEGNTPEIRQAFPAHLRSYAKTLRESWRGSNSCAARTLEFIADQAEWQLTPKPKPEEPTGYGAVVVDRSGVRWLSNRADPVGRHETPWHAFGLGEFRDYRDIDAVKVLSPGV